MPFIKPRKVSVTKWRIEACKRNGLRKDIFTPFLSSKIRYTGEWKNDKKDGKGTEFNLQTGLLYEGDWLNNARHGYGELYRILQSKNRIKIYAGNWINGQKEGFGTLCYKDGGYYEGNFVKNRRHGFGRMWHSNESFYQGTWKNDLYHGEGMLVLGNGNRYEGEFSLGKKEGRGVFYHITTGQLQSGCWLADTCLVNTMEDIYWRQSAPWPTSYPIPKIELTKPHDILQDRTKEVMMLCDPESSLYSENYHDYTPITVNCV